MALFFSELFSDPAVDAWYPGLLNSELTFPVSASSLAIAFPVHVLTSVKELRIKECLEPRYRSDRLDLSCCVSG